MESNLEEIIEYIINNFKYGSELNEGEIEQLFQKYSIGENCKKDVYSELDSLEIKLIFEVKNEGDDSFSLNQKLVKKKEKIVDEYQFLDDIDFEELDDILNGDGFKEEILKLVEVVDKKYNLEYIEDYSKFKDNPEKRLLSLERLITANEKLIWKIVERYKTLATTSFDTEDMYQAGVLGLMKAIDKFDLSKGYQLSTYATWWISQSISRSIMDFSTTIKVPVHMHEQIIKLTKLENELIDQYGYEINDEFLASAHGSNKKKVIELKKYRQMINLASLSNSIGEDGDSTLQDFVVDTVNDSPIVAIEKIELSNIIRDLCEAKLKPKEKEIIDLRFGLTDQIPLTLEEIGKKYKVTRERIRQIEAKAIRKLSTNYSKKRLGDFYDDSE